MNLKRTLVGWSILPVLVLACLLLEPMQRAAEASDHADPMILTDPFGNITGLFFFPKGDQMILVFNVKRALTAPKPYKVEPYTYVVHMDLHSKVTFDSAEDRARYGGTVPNPEGLKSDVTLTFHLNNDATLKDKKFEGLTNPESIRVYTGVRDDPFIFPRFFKKNVISMVLSIPMSSFPPGQQDWILWGSVYKDGKQIDHVGRSNRTQLGRFDSLNPLPPTEHVPEIMRLMKKTTDWFNTLNSYKETVPAAGLVQYVLQIRKYDVATDVMIYTNRFPPGFPNGRQLPDDIVGLTCATGDCILQELAFVEGNWPRQTVNDKPFSEDFPYLADPWPEAPEKPPATKSIKPLVIMYLILFILLSWALVQFLLFLFRKLFRKPARA